MRSKLAAKNIFVSMLLQVVVIICGLITPRLIISAFGSGYNGITASVTQFLSIITLLRAGIGGVTRVSLYKPLAEGDTDRISSIIKATEQFMRKIAYIFLLYVVILAVVYPFIIDSTEYGGWTAVSSYILILSIGTFAQYYFCISYQLLLTADQREYVANWLQILQTILNTIIVIVFVHWGATIHEVKLCSAIAFMITPVVLHLYVKRRYGINKKAKADTSALSQRWDALAHNVSDFIHGNTDILVLTFLASNVKIISVYTVYYIVINGIKKIVTLCTTGIEAAFGNMIAKGETDVMKRTLNLYEYFIYTCTTIMFSCVLVQIVPFVMLYTHGITDANYYQPIFATIATLAEIVYCIRIPYSAIVYACGHYKQTRNGAVAEAVLNLTVSILLVFGVRLTGHSAYAIMAVAIGTLIANTYRSCQFINYLVKNIINLSITKTALRLCVMFAEILFIVFISKFFNISGYSNTVAGFCLATFCIGVVISIVVITINSILFYDEMKLFVSYINKIVFHKK